MRNNKNLHEEHDDGSYVVNKSKKHSIFAFIVCILIAFVIWAYVEATEDIVKLKAESNAETTQPYESQSNSETVA